MEEVEVEDYVAHVVVLPYQGKGHMNPMIQFSKRLASRGLKITVATILSITKTMQVPAGSFKLESIYDDTNEEGNFKVCFERMETMGSQNLKEFIKDQQSSKNPVKYLIYDVGLVWGLNVAKELGIAKAAFFTQSCAANGTYYLMCQEILGEPFSGPSVLMSEMKPQGLSKLGSLGLSVGGIPPIIRLICDQISKIEEADLVLFNSFDKLEEEVVKWLTKIWPVKNIGPTVPSVYLDKRLENDEDYGFNTFKASSDDSDACLKWLDTKEPGSVVYASFDSVALLQSSQMEELASALKHLNKSFLWVVRGHEEKKLPSNFVEETTDKGLVVKWCPQLEVLAHPAVGCFLTHSGWNSTMEALSLGVPMVIMPQFLDQFTNAKFVEEIWETGFKPKVDEEGIARREEVEQCIRDVMEGERGEMIKTNVAKWKELAREAVDVGGSSDNNIDEIIVRIVSA